MESPRKIIHIDMDAFFAAVEQRDNPRYRDRPVVVGGDPAKRGVVAAASYEARRYGIHSAMPSAWAYRLCPQAVFLRPRIAAYRQVSRRIMAILADYADAVEPLSLDEAYLDVSHSELFQGSATLIARDIKGRIAEATALSASAGVSYNKFLAKLASDLHKPDGLTVITPAQGPTFAAALPVGKFHGVGKATEARMHGLGIHTGADLCAHPLEELLQVFGKMGRYYHEAARGMDRRPVETRRERKSLGAETTFDRDLKDLAEMLVQLERLAVDVAADLAARGLNAHTLTVKVKYADFHQVTRSLSFDRPLGDLATLRPLLPQLLARTEAGRRPVRLLGLTLSNLADSTGKGGQLELF